MPSVYLRDEFEITIPVDFSRQKCLICDELVFTPSVGGDLICPSCDLGNNRNGSRMDFGRLMMLTGPNSKAAKRRKELNERRDEIRLAVMIHEITKVVEQA